jgi:hypothetical protein
MQVFDLYEYDDEMLGQTLLVLELNKFIFFYFEIF